VKILVVDMFLVGLCIEKLGKFAKGIESRSRNIDMALELTATQLKVAGYLFIRVGIHSRHGYL